MNSLVGLFPGDTELHQQLADMRASQGDWYLAQESQTPAQTRSQLNKAAEAYRRALNDLPQNDTLIAHL